MLSEYRFKISNTFNVALKIERSFSQQINFLISIQKNQYTYQYINQYIYKNLKQSWILIVDTWMCKRIVEKIQISLHIFWKKFTLSNHRIRNFYDMFKIYYINTNTLD